MVRWGIRFPVYLLTLLSAVSALPAADAPQDPMEVEATEAEEPGQPAATILDAQVELHRRGFSCGPIDGVMGAQSAAALKAFQRSSGIAESGVLDAATRDKLRLASPTLEEHVIGPADVANLQPVPKTWLEKSQMSALGYGSTLELLGETFHTHPNLLRRLNPAVQWDKLVLGTKVTVPAVDAVTINGEAAQIVIMMSAHQLEVLDEKSQVIAHFPVSIAHHVEKRPVGELHVVVIIPNPDYTFDPDVFPESAEAKTLGRKLIIPPGPNNPVGVAWIGLDRPGYGIHGTPEPEAVGRTESHGCFRLANWDASTLLKLVQTGMRVTVEP